MPQKIKIKHVESNVLVLIRLCNGEAFHERWFIEIRRPDCFTDCRNGDVCGKCHRLQWLVALRSKQTNVNNLNRRAAATPGAICSRVTGKSRHPSLGCPQTTNQCTLKMRPLMKSHAVWVFTGFRWSSSIEGCLDQCSLELHTPPRSIRSSSSAQSHI